MTGQSSQQTDRPQPRDRRWAREYEMWRHQYLTMNFLVIVLSFLIGSMGVLTLEPLYAVIGGGAVAWAVWRAYAVYTVEKELWWVLNG